MAVALGQRLPARAACETSRSAAGGHAPLVRGPAERRSRRRRPRGGEPRICQPPGHPADRLELRRGTAASRRTHRLRRPGHQPRRRGTPTCDLRWDHRAADPLPVQWVLVNGYLLGPRSRLVAANLEGQDMAGAELQGAELQEARLRGSDLESAILAGAELRRADLSQANLKRSILTETELAGAELAGAELEGVRSGAVRGSPTTLPEPWSIAARYLIGPRADLRLRPPAGRAAWTALSSPKPTSCAPTWKARLSPAHWSKASTGRRPVPDGAVSSEHGETCEGHL